MKRRVTKRETHADINWRRASWHDAQHGDARAAAANCAGLAPRALAQDHQVRSGPGSRAGVPSGRLGGDGGSNASPWSPHRKQLVEALTAGSGLARASSVWYDKDDDTLRMPASLLAMPRPPRARPRPRDRRGTTVCRSCASTPGRCLAPRHGDSADASPLRGELERHIKGGGATVLVMPIVDPLIMDVGGPGAMRETMTRGTR